MINRLIVCDYLDATTSTWLEQHPGETVLTLFKEPFAEYHRSRIYFVDDVLEKSDYDKIDESVNNMMKVVRDAFSRHLTVEGFNLFQYLQLEAIRSLAKAYKYKYAVDKIVKERKRSTVLFLASEVAFLKWLRVDYQVTCLARSALPWNSAQMKSGIKIWIKKSRLIHYIVAQLFADRQKRPNYILWLGGRSSKSTLPHELKMEGFKIFLLQNDLNQALVFARRGVKYDLLRLNTYRKFNERWRRLEQHYWRGLEEIASITGLEIGLLEAVLKINKGTVKQLLLLLHILEDNKEKLGLLYVEQSVIGLQALAVDYFKRHGLPSLEVLHGVPAGVPVEVGNTTKIAVHGERDKEFLVNHGVDVEQIVITGSPRYDVYSRIDECHKTSEFLLLILDWILFIPSSQSHQMIFEQVMNMIELVKKLSNERVVIKLHPGQTEEELRYVQHLVNIAKVQKQVKVEKDTNLTTLLRRAKIVFTYTSSVGVEALLMKKPLIILDFWKGHTVEYEKYGGCFVATGFQELIEATEQILNDIDEYKEKNAAKIEKTRRYFSAGLDGKASRNVAVLCKALAMVRKGIH